MPGDAGDTPRPGFNPWVGKVPWRRAWQPTPVFLPGERHGQRTLAGCSPRGPAKSQTRLTTPTLDVGWCAGVNLDRNNALFRNLSWRAVCKWDLQGWQLGLQECRGSRKGLMAFRAVRKARCRSWQEDRGGRTSERKGEEKGLVTSQQRTSDETKGQDPAASEGMKWAWVHCVRSVTSWHPRPTSLRGVNTLKVTWSPFLFHYFFDADHFKVFTGPDTISSLFCVLSCSLAARHVGALLANQGSNPQPPHWRLSLNPWTAREVLSSVQFSGSVVSDSLQPRGPQHARPPVHRLSRSLLKLMPMKSVIPSNLLLLPSVFPSIRIFSNESALRIRWPKDWSFSYNMSLSNEHPGLISFRMDWLDLLAVQGTLRESSPTPQFKTINRDLSFEGYMSIY